VLRSARCLDRGVLDPDWLRAETLSPDQAWSLINLELWYRIFVDRDPHWVAQTRALTTEPAYTPQS